MAANRERCDVAIRKAECRAYYLARWAEGVNPGLAELYAKGWGQVLAVRVREQLISEGLIPRPAGTKSDRAPKSRRSTYVGPFVTVAPKPEVKSKAKPKEPKAKWLARLQAQIDKHAEERCMVMVDPGAEAKPKVIKPSGWETARDKKKAKIVRPRREAEFRSEFPLGISERG